MTQTPGLIAKPSGEKYVFKIWGLKKGPPIKKAPRKRGPVTCLKLHGLQQTTIKPMGLNNKPPEKKEVLNIWAGCSQEANKDAPPRLLSRGVTNVVI